MMHGVAALSIHFSVVMSRWLVSTFFQLLVPFIGIVKALSLWCAAMAKLDCN